jgi:hypothetical protein
VLDPKNLFAGIPDIPFIPNSLRLTLFKQVLSKLTQV